MAKFSMLKPLTRSRVATNTVNLAGGRAFTQNARLELVSVLITTFLEDEFYRTQAATMTRIRELIARVADDRFVAKASLYARHAHGLRSVSHFVAGELAKSVKGARWTKDFHARIVRRPDDALEILAYYLAVYGRPIPNSLKKGLAAALAGFDEYQLAKYRRAHGDFKIVDAVNLVRPRASAGLTKLMRGELPPAQTWETRLAQAGENADDDDAAQAKSAAWAELVRGRQMGYLALLRNVRNILSHAPEVSAELCEQLAEAEAVVRAKVFPFQFLSALDVLKQGNLPGAGDVMAALNRAIDHSLANVPKFGGRTLIALDSSGSMSGRPQAIGSLFAAALVKAGGADLMVFSDDARYLTLNAHDSTLTAAQSIPFAAGGTNFNAIFTRANRAYDRLIILSDMQAWIGGGAPLDSFAAYNTRFAVTPRVFSFDLKGYGTMQFPLDRVYCLAGWSDRVFEILQKLDRDPEAMVQEVEAVALAE